jgi:hypothetical protein
MFGKFLLTVAVIAIIWFGYRFLSRQAELRRRGDAGSKPGQPRDLPRERSPEPEAETLVECRACGAWQAARAAKPCGRPDCPY